MIRLFFTFFSLNCGPFFFTTVRPIETQEAVHQNDMIKVIETYQNAKANLQDPQQVEEELTALYHLIENWKPDLIIGCTVSYILALLFAKVFRIPAITMFLQLERPCSCMVPFGLGEKLPKFLIPFFWWLLVTYLTV